MGVDIYEWDDRILWAQLGHELNSKNALKQRLGRLLRQSVAPTPVPTPSNMQFGYIDLYGEQVTKDALADIDKYFTTVKSKGFTTGGLSTGFPPFHILPKDVKPSNTAIACIGEGLGGWYLEQRQGLVPLLRYRPIGVPIDLAFGSRTGAYYVLAQVKATQEPDVKAQMSESAVPLLQYTYNERLRIADVICYVIGVIIKPGNDFDLLSLKTVFH